MATSLLDTAHTATREAAASLAFNIAAYAQKQRNTGKEVLEEGDVVELFVSVLEAIQREGEGKAPGSKEALKGLLLTVFLLVYCVPEGSELLEVMTALEAGEVVRGKKGKIGSDNDDKLVEEVARLCSVRA